MFKLLFIGDPHFKVDNTHEVELFINKINELAKQECPDIICIGGDLLDKHERLHTIPLNKAYDLVERMRDIALTYVLVGNHDMISNQAYLNTHHWMNGMKEWNNVIIVDEVINFTKDGYHFVFCPYVSPGRFVDALNTNEQEWKNATCIFAHQEFYGCKMGAIVSIDGDKWDNELPPVVSGHIHSKQTIGNVFYTGSAMQHAFGESEENIIAVFTWTEPTKPYTCVEHDLNLPRKRIMYTDVEKIDDLKLPESEDKLKITVTGNYDEFKAFKKTKKYREIIDNGTKVVFKSKKAEIKGQKESLEEMGQTGETDFIRILGLLVNKEKNPYLLEAHELVVRNKNISAEDVFFLG